MGSAKAMGREADNDHATLLNAFRQIVGHENQRVELVLHSLIGHNAADLEDRLNNLVTSLKHQQVRDLRAAIDKVDLNCDIIAELPAEVRDMILQYLPLHQCFQIRRVSRKWYSILSAPKTVDALLNWWYPTPDIVEAPFSVPADLSPEMVASLKAEHVNAFRTGKPFSMMTHALGCFPGGLQARYVAYAHGVVAWIDRTDCRTVYALDLKTGHKRSLVTEDRSSVSDIAISSTLIAALGTSGKCHIWTFRTEQRFSIRLPSASAESLVVSSSTLAVMWPPTGSALPATWAPIPMDEDRKTEVLTWNWRSQRALSFFITLRQGQTGNQEERKLIIDSKGETLLHFERMCGVSHEGSEHFSFKRVTFNGDVLAEGVLDFPCNMYWHDISGMGNQSIDGIADLWAFANVSKQFATCNEVFQIYFNFEHDRLESRVQKLTGLTETSVMNAKFFFWKDVAYVFDTRGNEFSVTDFREASCHRIGNASEGMWPKSWTRARQLQHLQRIFFLGDENFVVLMLHVGFIVWSFNKHLKIANEDVK